MKAPTTRIGARPRRPAVLAGLAAAVFVAIVMPLPAAPGAPRVRVIPEGFEASRADIERLLGSASRELWNHFPGHAIDPVLVRRGRKGPITHFERTARGEIVVELDTHSTFWSQYSYQWAHELCHILCGYRNDGRENKWFEETLCELASLHVLRRMSESWETQPPYPHWKDYRHSLRKYADETAAKREKLAADDLAGFYATHREALRANQNLRDLNGAMAGALLPLFEKDPTRWEAVRWLNSKPAAKDLDLRAYFAKWHAAAPPKHRPFIARIAALYGHPLPPAAAPK